MRLTVGPLPSAVYWRRRAIVLSAGLVLLFLVAQACMAAAASPDRLDPGGTSATPTGSSTAPPATGPAGRPAPGQTGSTAAGQPDPADDPAPGPVESLDPAAPDTCTDQEMLITAESGSASFTSGTGVQFTIRIQNRSDRTCRRDIGGDHRELYLRMGTGATRVWSTRECGAPSGSEVRELAPDFEISHFIVWQGQSSRICQGGEPAGGQVEPGEYQLIARLGTAHSQPVTITVTG
jgi:hypothetical protein